MSEVSLKRFYFVLFDDELTLNFEIGVYRFLHSNSSNDVHVAIISVTRENVLLKFHQKIGIIKQIRMQPQHNNNNNNNNNIIINLVITAWEWIQFSLVSVSVLLWCFEKKIIFYMHVFELLTKDILSLSLSF